jgi:two-component system, chemotaxis family, sensor kinase CheA
MTDLLPQGFIQDFLEEANDHLKRIRQNLLDLDETISETSFLDPARKISEINELLRSFHTLKGLSGMVGLHEVEELSHVMESVLRAVQRLEIEITHPLIDQLLTSTGILEEVISTLHTPAASPIDILEDISAYASLLNQVDKNETPQSIHDRLPPPSAGKLGKYPQSELQTSMEIPEIEPILRSYPELSRHITPEEVHKFRMAREKGARISAAIFSPSKEKAAQGMTVAWARETLNSASELIKTIPVSRDESISFLFLIALEKGNERPGLDAIEWVEEGELALAGETNWGHANPEGAQQPVTDQAVDKGKISAVTREERSNLTSTAQPATAVRVDLERLDDLMRLVSNMVVVRSRITDTVPRLQANNSHAREELNQSVAQMDRNLRELRQAVMHARMVPLAEVFSHFPLVVRDLARASGKQVRLEIEGEKTEIDKFLVERLLNPLLHLVRNAIMHGIENPEERVKKNKTPQGILRICGNARGDMIEVLVQDDGGGIWIDRVIEAAKSNGGFDEDRLAGETPDLTNSELLELISRPGLTTKNKVDLGAGRGMGMDVVVREVTAIGGNVELQTAPDLGTTFSIRLPLTLSIIDALIIRCGTERYAIPQAYIDEVVEIETDKIIGVEKNKLYPARRGSLTLVDLSDLFGISKPSPNHFRYGLISTSGERRTALVVDQVVGLQEVVVRPITDPLVTAPGITGATELGDGSAILIIDLIALFQFAKKHGERSHE